VPSSPEEIAQTVMIAIILGLMALIVMCVCCALVAYIVRGRRTPRPCAPVCMPQMNMSMGQCPMPMMAPSSCGPVCGPMMC
jgi:heme/copper-type cytochrome/quinol oxidase subunit 2